MREHLYNRIRLKAIRNRCSSVKIRAQALLLRARVRVWPTAATVLRPLQNTGVPSSINGIVESTRRTMSTYGLLWAALICGTGFFWFMSHSPPPLVDRSNIVAVHSDKDPRDSLALVRQAISTGHIPTTVGPAMANPAPDISDALLMVRADPSEAQDQQIGIDVESTPRLPNQTPDTVGFSGVADSLPAKDEVFGDLLEIEPIDVQPFDDTVTGFQSAASARGPEADVASSISANEDKTLPAQVDAELPMTRGELISAFGQTVTDSATIEADATISSESDRPKPKADSPIMNLDHVASARDPYWWDAELQKPLLETGPPQTLELTTALALAIQLAPELHVLRADHAIAEQVVRQQEAGFDWSTFLKSSWDQDSTPVGSALDGAPVRLRDRNWTLRGGVRRTNQHGGQFEIAQNFGYRNSNSSFIRPNNQGSGRLSFDYTHPLMRQRGILYNTSPIALAEIGREIAHDNLMAGIENHLLEVANAYWDLVLSRGRLVQNKKAYDRAKQLFDSMSIRQKVDVRPNQLARAEASLLGNQSLVVESRHDTKRAQEILLRLIYGSSYTEQLVEVIPTTIVRNEVALADPVPHVDDGLRNRTEIQVVLREIRAATMEQELAANEILPMLNLVLSGYTAGLRGNSDVAGAFKNQFNSSEPGFGVGFEFEVPYRNRAAKAAADQRRIAVERFRRRFESVVADVTLDVRSQLVNVSRDTRLSEVRTQALDQTDRELQFLQTRYKLLIDGTRVSDLYLDNLVQTLNRFLSAESNVLRARIQLARSQMGLLRGKGMMHTLVAAEFAEANPTSGDEKTDASEPANPKSGSETAIPSKTDDTVE